MYVYIQTRAEWIVSRSLYILASTNQCKHHLFFTFIFVLSYVCQDDKVFLYHDVFFTLGKSRILKIEKQVLYTYIKK